MEGKHITTHTLLNRLSWGPQSPHILSACSLTQTEPVEPHNLLHKRCYLLPINNRDYLTVLPAFSFGYTCSRPAPTAATPYEVRHSLSSRLTRPRTHTHTHTHTHTCTCTHMRAHTCIHIRAHTHMHTHTHIHTHTHTHMHVHTHMHTRVHTHINTRTCTCTQDAPKSLPSQSAAKSGSHSLHSTEGAQLGPKSHCSPAALPPIHSFWGIPYAMENFKDM